MALKQSILYYLMLYFITLPVFSVGQRPTYPPPTARTDKSGPDDDYHVEGPDITGPNDDQHVEGPDITGPDDDYHVEEGPDKAGPDDDYDYLNFNLINNPEIRRYTQEYNTLCPHTNLCDVKVYYNQSLFQHISNNLHGVPCCGSCSCPRDTDCMETRECCIDALPRLLTTDEVRVIHDSPGQCINAQYRKFDVNKYNGESYILVTKCSGDYHDEEVTENCLQSYSDFDLDTEIPGFLPVTDNRTMTSYKNLYCGICNHVPRSELIFWRTEVECNESIVLDETQKVKTLSDIEQFIARDSRCNLVFEEPYYLLYRQPFIQKCKSHIDRCNVSGLWQNYDAELESLCTSYLSTYKGYRNVHCYLCNGFEISSIHDICLEGSAGWRPSSFVSLLDFNNLELSEKEELPDFNEAKACPQGKAYDTWAKVCRLLFCPDFAILINDECQPIFDGGTYDVTVRLVPTTDTMDVRLIPTLQDLIEDDVSRRLSAITSSSVVLCEIQTFVKLKGKLTTFIERTERTSYANISYTEPISYVALRALIAVQENSDVVSTIGEITEVLYGQIFDNIPGFEIVFCDIDFTLFEQQYNHFSNDIRGLPPNSFSIYNFFQVFEDPKDGHTILPVQPKVDKYCPNRNRLLPFHFCPLINLDESEFRVESNMVFLERIGVYVNMSDVVFSKNVSIITMCSNKYFSHAFYRRLPDENPYVAEFIVSVICTSLSLLCLLVVFATYCSYKTLRTLPGLNNMALVMSVFFAQLLYLFGSAVEIKANWLCETVGLLLHFSLVASFFWMGVCTFHMLKVFVFISKRPSSENSLMRPFIKYILFATLPAAIMVCINIIVSVTSGGPGFGYGGQPCYITDKRMILYTVAIPLGIIVICDFLMFAYVIVKVSRLPDVKKNTKHERRNIVIFAKLSTLTGLTWIFAYIYQWTAVKAFAYLFIVSNASQGLFIMFSFVINRRVWGMVNTSIKNYSFYRSKSGKTYENSAGKSNHTTN